MADVPTIIEEDLSEGGEEEDTIGDEGEEEQVEQLEDGVVVDEEEGVEEEEIEEEVEEAEVAQEEEEEEEEIEIAVEQEEKHRKESKSSIPKDEDEVEDPFLDKILENGDILEDIEGDDDNEDGNGDYDGGNKTKDTDMGYEVEDEDDTYCETDLEDISEDEVDVYDARSIYREACKKRGIRPLGRFEEQCKEASIQLIRTTLGDKQCSAIAHSLEANLEITSLNFSDCQLSGRGASALLSVLSSHDKLEELDLSKNKLGMEGIQALATLLAGNSSIKKLNLHGTNLDEPQFVQLAEALETCCVSHLDLSENRLGEQAGSILKGILEDNSKLEHLNISWNAISLRGARFIANALVTNSTLKLLDAGWNGFADEGAKAIANALKENSKLEELDISNNRITSLGLVEIAKSLGVNSTLKSLHIARNPINEDGMQELINTLSSTNTTIEFVNAENVPVSHAQNEKIVTFTTPSRNLLEERAQKRTLERSIKALQMNVSELKALDAIRENITARSPSTASEKFLFHGIVLAVNKYASNYIAPDLSQALHQWNELQLKMYLTYCGFGGVALLEAKTVEEIESIQNCIYPSVMDAINSFISTTRPSKKLKAAKDVFYHQNSKYAQKFAKRIAAGYLSELLFIASIEKYLKDKHPNFPPTKDGKLNSSDVDEYADVLVKRATQILAYLPNVKFSQACFEYVTTRPGMARDNREARVAASEVLNSKEVEEDGDEDTTTEGDEEGIFPVPQSFEPIAKMEIACKAAKKSSLLYPKEAETRAKHAILKALQEYGLAGVDNDSPMYAVLETAIMSFVQTKVNATEYCEHMTKELDELQKQLSSINKSIESCVETAHENGFRPLLHITTDAITDGQIGTHNASAWEALEAYMVRHEFSLVDVLKPHDPNHTGFISKEQFVQSILDIGVQLTEEEVEGMLAQEGIRETENGQIEYYRACKRRALKRMATQEMVDAVKRREESYIDEEEGLGNDKDASSDDENNE